MKSISKTQLKTAKVVIAAKMKDYTPEEAAKVLRIIRDSPEGSVNSPKFGGPAAWKLTPLGNLAHVPHRLQYHGLTKLVEVNGETTIDSHGWPTYNDSAYWVLDNRQLSPAEKLAAEVMDYAYANYQAGWDIVVESMSVEEIAQEVSGCKSVQDALKVVDENHVGNWVNENLNARWGEDDDEQLDMAKKYDQTKLSRTKKAANMSDPEDLCEVLTELFNRANPGNQFDKGSASYKFGWHQRYSEPDPYGENEGQPPMIKNCEFFEVNEYFNMDLFYDHSESFKFLRDYLASIGKYFDWISNASFGIYKI